MVPAGCPFGCTRNKRVSDRRRMGAPWRVFTTSRSPGRYAGPHHARRGVRMRSRPAPCTARLTASTAPTDAPTVGGIEYRSSGRAPLNPWPRLREASPQWGEGSGMSLDVAQPPVLALPEGARSDPQPMTGDYLLFRSRSVVGWIVSLFALGPPPRSSLAAFKRAGGLVRRARLAGGAHHERVLARAAPAARAMHGRFWVARRGSATEATWLSPRLRRSRTLGIRCTSTIVGLP